MQRAYDILEYHSYIQQVYGGERGTLGLIWVNPSVLKDTKGTRKQPNYPNGVKTIGNTANEEGAKESLLSPSSPNKAGKPDINQQKEKKQASPTTTVSQMITENNNSKSNYTTSQNEYWIYVNILDTKMLSLFQKRHPFMDVVPEKCVGSVNRSPKVFFD